MKLDRHELVFVFLLLFLLGLRNDASACSASFDENLQLLCRIETLSRKTVSQREVALLETLLERQGAADSSNVKRFLDVSLRPTLKYYDNYNGGNPSDPLEIGNVVFIGNPDFYGYGDTGQGLEAVGKYRRILGREKYIDLSYFAGIQVGVKNSETRRQNSGRACFNTLLVRTTWGAVCYSNQQFDLPLRSNEVDFAELEVKKAVRVRDSYVMFAGSVAEEEQKSSDPRLISDISVAYTCINCSYGIKAEYSLRDKIKSSSPSLRSISSLSFNLRRYGVRFQALVRDLQYKRASFFGAPWTQEAKDFSLNLKRRRIGLGFRLSQSKSSIPYFSDSEASIFFNFNFGPKWTLKY